MKINKENLSKIAQDESEEEKLLAKEHRENRDLYKASMKIAMKIKRAMRLANMNQTQLAQKMGLNPAVISRLLNGKANLELKTMVRFEKELGISIIDRVISPYSQSKGSIFSANIYYINNMQMPVNNIKSKCTHLNTLECYYGLYPNKEYSILEENHKAVNEPLEKYS